MEMNNAKVWIEELLEMVAKLTFEKSELEKEVNELNDLLEDREEYISHLLEDNEMLIEDVMELKELLNGEK